MGIKKGWILICCISIYLQSVYSRESLTDYVDPYIGTVHYKWFNFTQGVVPFGMAKVATSTLDQGQLGKWYVMASIGLFDLKALSSEITQAHPYRDLTHDSKVFGTQKYYRLYLPKSYSQSTKRYPVIYFFHGWGGRYNKEPSAKPEYEMLGDLVDKYQVIMVMWDGSMEESEPRPYNTGDHDQVKYQVQMKDYFLELVEYIDTNYRTLNDRDHRGIIGFSMGGFMSMVIAGKYPDKVSAITNMVGSPEFFLGYPDNHTLYPLRYLFDNLKDVSLRMHSMDNCPLVYMNTEIKNAAAWEGRTDFEYWIGPGDHKADEPGETKLFEMAMQFIVNRFDHPVALRKSWSHYDLYPAFDVWGYSVKSDKHEPGFLYLRNVSPAGFGFYTLKWAPDGPSIRNCNATITTAPLYKKGKIYDVLLYKGNRLLMKEKDSALYRREADNPLLLKDKDTEILVLMKEKAGQDGRIIIDLPGDGYEVSITHKSQPADFIVLNYQLDADKRLIRINEKNELILSLLNRGGNAYSGKELQLSVNCTDPSVTLTSANQVIKTDKKEKTCKSQPVGISCTKTPPRDASPPWIKLNVQIRCGKDIFYDAITVPIFYDVPYFSDIRIDDGIEVQDKAIGTGNGDGQAGASEHIMIYEKGHRLRLYTDDPYVETASEILYDEILQSIWPDGFTLSSIVKIADDCPSGHVIEFLANYETKTYMPIYREVHWGKVKITVK